MMILGSACGSAVCDGLRSADSNPFAFSLVNGVLEMWESSHF